MELVSMVLLAVNMLALMVLSVLFLREKQRSNQRYQAMLGYVDRYAEDVNANCDDSAKNLIDQYASKIREDVLRSVNESLNQQNSKIQEQLENLVLDYAQAQSAASRINDFGASLASIFDYDPLKAIQKSRNKEAG